MRQRDTVTGMTDEAKMTRPRDSTHRTHVRSALAVRASAASVVLAARQPVQRRFLRVSDKKRNQKIQNADTASAHRTYRLRRKSYETNQLETRWASRRRHCLWRGLNWNRYRLGFWISLASWRRSVNRRGNSGNFGF